MMHAPASVGIGVADLSVRMILKKARGALNRHWYRWYQPTMVCCVRHGGGGSRR
jgi:hypothetical protein